MWSWGFGPYDVWFRTLCYLNRQHFCVFQPQKLDCSKGVYVDSLKRNEALDPDSAEHYVGEMHVEEWGMLDSFAIMSVVYVCCRLVCLIWGSVHVVHCRLRSSFWSRYLLRTVLRRTDKARRRTGMKASTVMARADIVCEGLLSLDVVSLTQCGRWKVLLRKVRGRSQLDVRLNFLEDDNDV